jgi:hypothetical protein
MTADKAMPDHDCKGTGFAVIFPIIRSMISVVMRPPLNVIDVPTIIRPGVLPVQFITSIEGVVS